MLGFPLFLVTESLTILNLFCNKMKTQYVKRRYTKLQRVKERTSFEFY
jgi:hypothetical protein